ncbi:hypothetical protein M3204_09700 [Mesobacillus subterraneus]|nr:hypothetical protein [Mesobacillus subterraneus]
MNIRSWGGYQNRAVPVFKTEGVEKLKKWIMLAAVVLFVVIGGAGCMSSESKVLAKLEEKYNQKFSIEGVKEGSKAFAQMYGKDRLTVHPEGNKELVFLAQEVKAAEGDFKDNFIQAKWAEELKQQLSADIEKELPEGTPYKIQLFVSNNDIEKSMLDMPVEDYLKNVNQNVSVVLLAGIKTAGEPQVEKYKENIYNLYQLMKGLGTTGYSVTIGFVDESEDISDYVRTSFINNISWSNLDAKVYGNVTIDERHDPENPSGGVDPSLILESPETVVEHYEPLGE